MEVETPRAIVIEDSSRHQFIAETLLGEVGFAVTLASSLVQGLEQVWTLLDPAQPERPTLILLDCMLPHERCPILEGIALAAHAIEAMEVGNLHPAHIVVISGELTEQRRQEAQIVGCRMTLAKPLTAAHAAMLRTLAAETVVLPSHTMASESAYQRIARQALRREAAQTMHFLRSEAAYGPAVGTVQWDADQVRSLLYEPATLLRTDPWRSWIQAHGGIEQVWAKVRRASLSVNAHEVLERILDNIQYRQSTSAEALARQLNLSPATVYRRIRELLDELAPFLM